MREGQCHGARDLVVRDRYGPCEPPGVDRDLNSVRFTAGISKCESPSRLRKLI